MRLTVPENLLDQSEGFSTELDIFNRKEFGDRLYRLISNSNENLVLALDAQWGEGKSTFIKMWTGENKHKQEPPLETIYFDAFENDYQKDPFLALASEVYELLEDKVKNKKDEFKQKAAQVFKAFSRGIIRTGIRVSTAGLIDGTALDKAEHDFSTLVSEQVDTIISSKFESSKADKMALSSFKEFLSDIALNHTKGKRIVFVIDELDRCRPDFALDLLENIKHLFSVPGVTFLLVMNRHQLEESVKSRYGSGIDSTTYLQKFINLWLTLPRSTGNFQNDDGAKYLNKSLRLMLEEETLVNDEAYKTLASLIKHLKPSFRDIERMLTYFAIIQNSSSATRSDYYQDMMAVVCFLIVKNPNLLASAVNGSKASQELLVELNLIEANFSDEYTLEQLSNAIKFDLADEVVRQKMLSDNSMRPYFYGRSPSGALRHFYQLLLNIEPSR